MNLLRPHIAKDYPKTLRPAGGALKHPFITPGSEEYEDVLWDWDSWTSNWALRQILLEQPPTEERLAEIREHERGCILNFLECPSAGTGYLPIVLNRTPFEWPPDVRNTNLHKPCIAQHAAFLVQQDGGDAEWLRENFKQLSAFIHLYRNYHRLQQIHRQPAGLAGRGVYREGWIVRFCR